MFLVPGRVTHAGFQPRGAHAPLQEGSENMVTLLCNRQGRTSPVMPPGESIPWGGTLMPPYRGFRSCGLSSNKVGRSLGVMIYLRGRSKSE